jgi:hypothetical protein
MLLQGIGRDGLRGGTNRKTTAQQKSPDREETIAMQLRPLAPNVGGETVTVSPPLKDTAIERSRSRR